MDELDAKLAALRRELEATGGVMVAFSGGADSAFLLAVAELADARALAAELGLRHLAVPTHEDERPGYLRNGPDRCFFCKDELFTRLEAVAREHGGMPIVYGAIMDDLGDHRPGMEAAKAKGVRAPLIEAELWKGEVREIGRALGLPNWDKPSFACLSSRFQYGDTITPEKLRQVDRAEAFLRELGFRQFRVRHHDRLARIELPPEEMTRIWEEGRHTAIVRRFRELGYAFVTLDLQGFRSGSANEALQWIAKK